MTDSKPKSRQYQVRPFRKLTTAQDVKRARTRVANWALLGVITPPVANAVGYQLQGVQDLILAEEENARLRRLEELAGQVLGAQPRGVPQAPLRRPLLPAIEHEPAH